jgi:type I restriction enzyme R subunit
MPSTLHGDREAAVLYNNLSSIPSTGFQCPADDGDRAELALRIDQAVRQSAPAGWKADKTREAQLTGAVFPLLDRDREAMAALIEIIRNQPGY